MPFFKDLGIDPEKIHGAFEIAKSKLPSTGVLLQFFDTSDNYQFVDNQAYIAKISGRILYPQVKISKIITDESKTDFPQFRLLMNNENTLNPQSPLSIRRYDLLTPEKEKEYENAMREYFRNLTVDTAKKDAYYEKITSIWNRNFGPVELAA